MSSWLGGNVVTIHPRWLCQPGFGGKVENLATVGYQKSVRWSPTREEKWKVETGGRKRRKVLTYIASQTYRNFSSMPRKLRSEKREKLTKIRKSASWRKEEGKAE